MRDNGVYVISVASELAGVHPQTLRIYERKGLLDPARTSGGSRRYSDADLERLRRISALTDAGVNLEGVRRILDLEDEADRLRRELDGARAEADRQVQAVEAHYRRDLVPVRPGALVPLRPPRRPTAPRAAAPVITQRRP
jgi:MerR family transcriptional regulator, heat shock protein HspR